MSDEKSGPAADVAAEQQTPVEPVLRPAGWMYRAFKLGKREYWYASPQIQLLLVAMVCFLCPGMFNALGGLGGGGQIDTKAQDDANTALYSTFAVVGFFSGSFANRLGIKLTMSLGGIGYCIYAASFLCYSHTQNRGFVVFAGAFLGVCAGLLWTAVGSIILSYPPENSKGKFISRFWLIFNTGAVIGALIPLGQNVHKTSGPVTDGTYAAFIALMAVGMILSLVLCNANKIIRDDGSRVILMKNPSWASELQGLWETLYTEPWIIALFPMFFSSNIFYTYQGNDFNAPHFDVRTRALNNVFYWLAQIIAAVVWGYALDWSRLRRSVRGKISFGILFSLTFIIWGAGWAWQKQQVSRDVAENDPNYHTVDWTDGGKKFGGPFVLYYFYGTFDALWQTSIYWYMGSFSNSSRKTANYSGFYKGIQSAGAAVFWRLDSLKEPYNTMYGSTFGCLAASLVIAAPVIWFKVQDTISLEQDLKFSDETIEDVAPAAIIHQHEKTSDA